MPSHVRIFWWLTVAATSYVVLSYVWYYTFPSAHDLATWAKLPERFRSGVRWANIEFFAVSVVVSGMWLTLAWFAAYRRKNWARWTIAVWFLLGLASPAIIYIWYIVMDQDHLLAHYFWQAEMKAEVRAWTNPRRYVVPSLKIASLVFIFTGNARDWFKPQVRISSA